MNQYIQNILRNLAPEKKEDGKCRYSGKVAGTIIHRKPETGTGNGGSKQSIITFKIHYHGTFEK